MDHSEDFVIENGVLKKYKGSGGDVIVPADVREIGDSAFSWCRGLTSITIPAGVTNIADYAFYCCRGLTSITLPAGVTKIGMRAFYYCEGLTSITIPDGVREIGQCAFEECSSLTSIALPNSVTEIGGCAFPNGSKLEIDYNGAWRVPEICGFAFFRCSSLKKITVEEKNPNYAARDGMLFSKDLKTLIKCPQGKKGTLTLPEDVTTIRECAFSGCKGLTSITLPTGVTEIREGTFQGCELLERVSVSSKIKIQKSAFDGSDRVWLDMPFGFPNETIRERSVIQSCTRLSEDKYPDEQAQQWKKYIRSQRKKLYDLALREESVLQYMLQNEIVAKEDIDDLIEKAGNPTARSALMEYADKHIAMEERVKKQDQELEAAFTGILTTEQAKKVWTCENIGTEHIRIKGYKGEAFTVNIPTGIGKQTVTEIGESAFSPEAPRIQKTIRAYRKAITEVTLPASVTKIGKSAFFACTDLTDVTLPARMTKIGDLAFSGCSSLTSIVIPASMTRIGKSVFSGCCGLTSVTLSARMTRIGDLAFYGCSGLTSITLPGSLTKIGTSAFSGCCGLTSITIPESVTEIGNWAFRDCEKLTSITLPESVTKIGDGAFCSCSRLTSITLPKGITEIRGQTFSCCHGLTSITIPESVTMIGEYAFSSCHGLTNITIPESLTTIGKYTFFGCSGLTSITLPEGITKIEKSAFYGCKALTIHAPAGSYAETYAKENNIPFAAE